jgi:chromosome segregation ATPase
MSNYTEALRILRKHTEEERNWRSAVQNIEVLLQAAEDAEKTLFTHEKRKEKLIADVAALAQRQQELNGALEKLQRHLAELEPIVRTQEQERRSHLESLNNLIAVRQAELDRVTTGLDNIKAQLGVA